MHGRLGLGVIAGASLVLATAACTPPLSEEASFELWGDEVRPELETTPGSGSIDGRDGAPATLTLDGGVYTLGVACRGVESTTLEVSSDWQVVAEIEVDCGEGVFAEVDFLPNVDNYITVDDDADWYVVFNH